ncbi:unnamed protein product [Paramecium octaurelia]|uniref:Uncharacterized protein n=1 Tax=Paramecium octaurelia TaxID=43137 RepID=A0A8S1T0K7_PAROT|nr:unnamed protein product [Paramecium octaurelia]
MIFWIDNTSIYDCRTYSLIKPQQYDVAIILDYIKQEQQQNRIDVKEKLPKLLKTLALLLIIHNKNDIFRLLQILASKDFNQTKLFNDFMNNPAALWYIEQMKVEPVQMIMHQYILGEYKFLESLFKKIISSYEQYLLKLQNGQGTQEFNLQGDLQSNQNQTSQNKKKSRFHKNSKQENQNQINKIQVSEVQLEQNTLEEAKSNQDSINQQINTEQAQKQNLEVIQQQQINKEKTLIQSIEIEDKTHQQQQQSESNRQQSVEQQVIQNQKQQNNQENPKGSYFSEQQKISLESVFKDDLPDQKLLGIPTMDKIQQQQTFPSFKSKSNPKQQEQVNETSEKINNTEQPIANNNLNNESDKINQLIDTLSEKVQQEFDFSQDTELIKLYDLLKEKCQQNYWWSQFEDRCHKAMSDKELELIMLEKLPILMKRWAIKTRKNVTEIETTLTGLHRASIQETTNTLVDNQNPEGQKIIHISSSPEKFEYTKLIEDNSLKQNQKNSIKNSYDFLQPQIHKQQEHLDYINKESNNFISRVDEDTFIKQNQLLQNEIQEVTPYQIIDIDDEIFKSYQGDINKKGQSSKIIKTASNRLNSELTKSKELQPENVDKQYKLQETQQQQSHSNKSNIIYIESSNENISKMQQPTPQQQTGEGIKFQNQNIACSTIQQGNNQRKDDIDNLFQEDNDIYSPDSIVSSSSILISDQSSIQFGEIQANKKQVEFREQINQQKDKDILKGPEKNVEKPNVKAQREEEQKSRDKKLSESDIDVKEKQKNKNNKRQHQKERSENSKTRSKKDSKEKKRAKSSQQSKRKEKSKDNRKRKSSERKSGQDILKQLQAENEAKERLKEEQKKKEKERIHQENIKKAELRLQKLRFEEMEFQKEYDYHQQQDMLKEIKERELKEQQYQHQHQHHHHHHQHQHKKYQQKYQQSYQNYKNDNQIQEQNQKTKPFEKQVQDQQYVNADTKFKHHNQNHNQQNQQKMQESQSYGNRSQQNNQGHEKSMMPHTQQNNQWDSQNNQQFHQQNYKQNDRHQRNQNSHDQGNGQQNQQQQRQNSYAFPLEQYGIQEFLTKKDQTNQKNLQKSIVNPMQYDLEQVPSPSIKQNNYRKQQQQQSQQQYPQQFQQQQYESQQQQQPFQQQQQYQYPQQHQFYNNQKPRDNKFRNQSPHRQQGFQRQKQHYQNHQEPHVKKQRKFNPYHEQCSNNQSFNYNQGPSNQNTQPYSYQDQMNNNQIPYKNSSSYPPSPIHSSNQPSKQQMFEFFCSMFYDKFQSAE